MNTLSIAVRLSDVNKTYAVHHEKPTLIENLIKQQGESFFALKNISLEIKHGQKVGIIGKNGSGKTTLLKIMAGITTPTSGVVETHGRVVSLIDLEAGFHPDLTGEQNIFLNGALLGMRRNEIAQKLKQIITFSGIGKFIDLPVFTYSQGMKLRLGFSIVIHADPDILLFDEGLYVGDKDFQKISQQRIEHLGRAGKTIVVVGHWLEFIERHCNIIFVLDEGNIITSGTKSLIQKYKRALL